jgi:hypothetical protein
MRVFALCTLVLLWSGSQAIAGGVFDGTYRGPMKNVNGATLCGSGPGTATWTVRNDHVLLRRKPTDATPLFEFDIAADGSFHDGTSRIVGEKLGGWALNTLSGRIEGHTLKAEWNNIHCVWAVVLEKVD